MENIRIIKEKIRSCISCDENQCARIKERLDQHVQSHHSSLKRSFSQQIAPSQKYSRILYPSRGNISDLKSDEQTSTSSLLGDKATENLNTSYKEGLRAIVLEFVKNLRKNQNAIYSNREENIINEFIENITKAPFDQTDDKYDVRLDSEIDELLNSVPANIDTHNSSNMVNVKEKFTSKINDFNANNLAKLNEQNENINEEKRKISLRDNNATAYNINKTKNNKQDASVQSNDVDILINSISDTNSYSLNNINEARKRSVDTQFPSVSGTFYANTKERISLSKHTQENNDVKDSIADRNINKYLQERNTNFINHSEKNIGTDNEVDKFKVLIYETVAKNLIKYNLNIYSEIISEEVINFLSENRHLMHENSADIEVKLFNIIKTITDISDVIVDEIINSIMNTLRSSRVNMTKDILDHYSLSKNSGNEHYFGNVISVFKTEQNLSDPTNNLSSPIRKRRSSILKKTKSNSEEAIYTEKLISLIKAWIDILPKKQNKVNKKLKESLINNLVVDILDQVKLEQVASDTSKEKEKYISFFIYRWLNKYEYFEDINDGKPYVYQLVEKITEIPLPNLAKTQNESQKAIKGINMTNQIDLLGKEVMDWFNEQQSKVFVKKNTSEKNELTRKFVLKMHDTINKCLPENLNNEIMEWLSDLVKPENKQNIPSLAETLQRRIEKVMQNKSNDKNDSQKQIASKRDFNSCCGRSFSESVVSEGTVKELIKIYLDHKYNSENFISRKACAELFKSELKKINSIFKVENNTCPTLQQQQTKVLDKLSKDLQYIEIITDWIKEIPLEESLNKTKNFAEAELIINTAKHIRKTIDDTQKTSCEAEYNNRIKAIIENLAEQFPIPTKFKSNMEGKINVLTRKIAVVKYNSPINCCSMNNSVLNSNLTDYIEAYIRENDDEIFEDDLKLKTCILRLFEKISNNANTSVSVNDASDKFTDISLTHNETVKHFSLEMDYAKEISDWLKNLPLLSYTDRTTQDQLILLINDLAAKISNTDNDSEIKNYITNWISKLPLDPNKEIIIPVVIQQITNRIKRVNKEYAQKKTEIPTTQKLENDKPIGKVCEYPHSCCNKTITCEDNRDPATVIVEYIEEWCNDLPIQAENETISKTLKENVTSKLLQKFGELNMNPEYFKNNILYEEMFSEEIDSRLENLPQNPTLHSLKRELKKRLLDVIIEQRNKIKTKISGVEYKHDLEKTIEISIPNIVPNYKADSPGFKLYKDRLAMMFILDNFDHGNDAVKLNYKRKIREQIEKYFNDIQDNNTGPLTNDQIYNELYSLLFSVPLPNESSMIDEIEEIKTRCEIDNWFETLPLREATGLGELLERDQILAMLAKRLHEFEKYENDSDTKMHREITKWLARLPILPDHINDIDKYVNDLQKRLKTTQADRRHVSQISDKSQESITDQNKSTYNSSITVESRSLQVTRPLSLPTCCQTSHQKSKKPADMILEVVETWCQQLPLPSNTQQEKDNTKVIKDNLIIKIIMKISELNMNPETFNDDYLYDALLDDELENLMSKLPTSYEVIQSKNARKLQLKEAIKSIKPLIEVDKARYDYKVEIKNTVDEILNDPHETSTQKNIYFNTLKEEVVDSIILYNFNKDDQENSFKYKMLVHDAVDKYYTLIDKAASSSSHTRRNSILKSNQLLYEMAKVPTPGENVIQEEVQEIKIKLELSKFLNSNFSIVNKDKLVTKNQIKSTLAKQINCSITTGDIFENKNKIKEDIIRNLKKLDENIDFKKVDLLLNQLEYFTAKNEQNSELRHDNAEKQNISMHNDVANKVQETVSLKEKTKDEQWLSLLPLTPSSKNHDNYYDYTNSENVRTNDISLNKKERKKDFDHSLNESDITYERFEKGALLSSSAVRQRNDQEKFDSIQSTKHPSATTSNTDMSMLHIYNNKTDDTSLNQNHYRNPDKNLENRASALTVTDHQKNKVVQSNQKSFKPLGVTKIHKNVDQDSIDQSNQTQYPQRPQSQTDNFTAPTPDSKQKEPLYMVKDEQERHREMPSMTSQTPNILKMSDSKQYNQNAQMTLNQFPVKTQDAYTQVTGNSLSPSKQSIPTEPIPFQNFREPSSFIPSTSIPGHISPGRISPQKAMKRSYNRGQPCRRPSISIFSPTALQRCNEFDEMPPKCNTEIPDEDSEMCDCLNKRKRPNFCSAHMRRHCRICNENNSFCRPSSYRYPSFYYHRF